MAAIYAFRPRDRTRHPRGIDARAPSTLAAWLRRFPDSQPSDDDQEDWIENAVILEAADKAGLDLTLLPTGPAVRVSGAGWCNPVAKPGAPVGAMLGQWSNQDFMKGLPLDMDPVGSDKRSCRAAVGYATSSTFLSRAGRPLIPARGDVQGEGGLEDALRRTVEATGSGEIFIKTIDKEWAAPFTVDPSSPKDLWEQLVDADMALERTGEEGYGLGWIPVHHEGGKAPVLLIQGRIRPTFEYRIVVIDGRPVTGAGCVEAFTPAENEAVFDSKMEEVRSDGNVVSRPDLVSRYLGFADAFCADFAAECGEGLDYSLDVCVDAATGNVVPIELNPPLNLGAYARDTAAWLAAIVARTERIAAERS